MSAKRMKKKRHKIRRGGRQQPQQQAAAAKPEEKPKILPRQYFYEKANAALSSFGVIVQWEKNVDFSHKKLQEHLREKMKGKESPIPRKKGSLRPPVMPYTRSVGPHKCIVYFEKLADANAFSLDAHPLFYAFIPLSFVVVVGVAVFVKAHLSSLNLKELRASCTNHEIMQWRKKPLSNSKTQVTISFRGTRMPESLNFKGDIIPVQPYRREPTVCKRCLRYGHRTPNCTNAPRCGRCHRENPLQRHMEKKCPKRRMGPVCLYCQENHSVGYDKCVEHIQQRMFKMQLVNHNMDYLAVLQSEIRHVRSTPVNSSSIF